MLSGNLFIRKKVAISVILLYLVILTLGAVYYYNLTSIQITDSNLLSEFKKIQFVTANDPDNTEELTNKGWIYQQSYDGKNKSYLKKAEEEYRNVLEINPDYVEAKFNLAAVLRELGEIKEAKKLFREIVQKYPHHVIALYHLAQIAISEQSTDEAIQYLNQILKYEPTAADVHNDLGNLYLSKGDTKKAVASFEHAIKFNPELKLARKQLEDLKK